MQLQSIERWHNTKAGHFVFGFTELILAYVAASLAINSGRLWEYAIAFILLLGGIRNLARIFTSQHHELKKGH